MACNAYCNALPGVFRPRLLLRAINEADRISYVSAINEAFSSDGDWFRLAPFGDFPVTVTDPKSNRTRRVIQRIDEKSADEIVGSFNSVMDRIARGFRGLPIFVGHADDPEWRKANPSSRAEAVGRIKEVQKRADGIWARRALNDDGKRLISGEAAPYDAHSPHWGMREIAKDIFRPVELYSTALTNTPNIPGNVIGLNEAAAENTSAMKTAIIAFLAALGRPVSNPSAVTDEQLATAINEATPVATQLVTASNELTTLKPQLVAVRTDLSAVQGQLTTASNEATTLRTQLQTERTARVEVLLTSAINEGRITTAQRAEWQGKLTANGVNFDVVVGDLGKLKKAINTRNGVAGIGGRKGEANIDSSKISAINEAVEAKKKAQPNISHTDAYLSVQKEKPELFRSAAE